MKAKLMQKGFVPALVEEVATLLHEDWRVNQWGKPDPRMKKTSDAAWIAEHGTDQVNINDDFAKLPSDWQQDNRSAAETVVSAVVVELMRGKTLAEIDVHGVAASAHEAWLARRLQCLDGRDDWFESLLPRYTELPKDEREKDSGQVVIAIEAIAAAIQA